MKKLVIFLVCVLIMILSTSTNCQELMNPHNLQNQTLGIKNRIQSPSIGVLWTNTKYLVSKPGYSKYYEWVDNNWQYLTNTTFTYNERGVLIEELINIMVPGDTKYNSIWIYDNYDNLIEYNVYHWINKNWEIYLSQTINITYDDYGNILEVISQILEEDIWINFWKTEYELGNEGEWIAYIEYVWENETWVNDLKHLDIVWYSWENFLVQSYIVQSWEDEWLNDDSYQYTYDANGFIRIREKFENENWILKERETYTFSEFEEVGIFEIYEEEVWVNNERYSVIYDEFGSMTNYTVEYWEDENWIIDFDMKILLTYNGNNDIVEEIVQLWSTTYQIWFNAQRFDYYAFQYFELGDEENDLEARINIYPNPVTNTLSLDFNGELINEGVIQIFNEAGQKVFEDKLMGIHNKIDVSTLPNGMYLLRLKKNKNSVIHQKILKQ